MNHGWDIWMFSAGPLVLMSRDEVWEFGTLPKRSGKCLESRGRLIKSNTTTINAPTAPAAFFSFLLLFHRFYNEDKYDKFAFEKHHSQARLKEDRIQPILNWALIHLLYTEREKQLTFNDIESASVWAWTWTIQTWEASHILLLSHSRAQHFLKRDLQLNAGNIWHIILIFHSCAGMLYSRGSHFWVNNCGGVRFGKVKYPGDVLCCDYGNPCITNSTWLLSLHSCVVLLGISNTFLNQIMVHLLHHCYFWLLHSTILESC